MFGFEDTTPGGGGATARTTTNNLVFGDGRWAHAELLSSDYSLAELVTPPSGVTLQGRTREVPVTDTPDTFTFAERPPRLETGDVGDAGGVGPGVA